MFALRLTGSNGSTVPGEQFSSYKNVGWLTFSFSLAFPSLEGASTFLPLRTLHSNMVLPWLQAIFVATSILAGTLQECDHPRQAPPPLTDISTDAIIGRYCFDLQLLRAYARSHQEVQSRYEMAIKCQWLIRQNNNLSEDQNLAKRLCLSGYQVLRLRYQQWPKNPLQLHSPWQVTLYD